MYLTSLSIIFIAILSALSRGLISNIDRFQIGIQKNSVLQVNLFNNLFTMVFVIILAFYFPFGEMLLDWKVIVYSAIVQFVAVGYSVLFKKMTIFESVISAKAADIFIPVAVFLATGVFSVKTYFLAILTTFLVVLWLRKSREIKKYFQGILIIVPLLVVQAYTTPLLVEDYHHDFRQMTAFTLCTLVIRFLISLISMFFDQDFRKMKLSLSKNNVGLYALRSVLTVTAQFTFVLVTSDRLAALAWIFLNMTSLYGILFSGFILHEKTSKKGVILILSLTGLMIIGNFL
ncbi:hypothetical protein [Lactovum odontotermitis]